MGVQDFDPEVQEAIGRRQTLDETRGLVAAARALGFASINFDLVYGLPRQGPESFERGLERLVELRPDRVAIYSFAFVPWARPLQKRIDPASLPPAEVKVALYLAARERLAEAGYEAAGIDHWALAGDELARAARERRLERNFMGYSPRAAATTVAFGVSGIGEIAGGYFQNHHRLATWEEAIAAGRLPIERGLVLDADDRARRHVIHRLLCDFRVDKRETGERFGIDFDAAFAAPLARLAEWNRASPAPLVENRPAELAVTESGRLFVRNVCMAFDRYLESRQAAGRPVFSRTV
jgi:oxygen-independent coproporphyrinogen-3 oxidase